MRTQSKLLVITAAITMLSALIAAHQPARAAGPWYVVPGGSDGNDCASPVTACASIDGAEAKPAFGADDVIRVGAGTFTGTGTQVVALFNGAFVSGGWDNAFASQNGLTQIDGQGARRGILVYAGLRATLERMVVTNGYAYGDGGSAIKNNGSLLVKDSVVSNNVSTGLLGSGSTIGGAILNAGGTLTLTNSLVFSNTSISNGGGILNNGVMTLNHSSVKNNRASFPADGYLFGGGGISNAGVLTLNDSSVERNTAYFGGGIDNYGSPTPATLTLNNTTVTSNAGGGIHNFSHAYLNSSTVTANNGVGLDSVTAIRNTIVAGNLPSDCTFPPMSLGYNLIGDTTGCNVTPAAGDLFNVNANLGPEIGMPGYYPLRAGSPAIDHGNPGGCASSNGILTTDERGAPRTGRCDIGAYEFTLPGPVVSASVIGGSPQRTPPLSPFWLPLQVLLLDSLGTPVDHAAVSYVAPDTGPGATFLSSGTLSATILSDGDGVSGALLSANALTGTYTISAATGGITTPLAFVLSNGGWYVATGGNNANDCALPGTPCATINGVLAKPGFVSNDTMLVGSGVYSGEVVAFQRPGRALGGWNTGFAARDGMSVLDGGGVRRAISITTGTDVALDHFVVQRGAATDEGGGIRNLGNLTLDHSVVLSNTVSGTANGGGGIYNGGSLVLNNSSVQGNTIQIYTANGAGIDNAGYLTLNNSTVSGNVTGGNGEGGGVYAGYSAASAAVLNNSTVASNHSAYGGGIGGNATIRNSVVAGNTAIYGSDDCSALLVSAGYNLLGKPCNFTPAAGDIVNVSARLFPLIGRPGFHPLLPGSPAINAGNPAGCMDGGGNLLPADERGVSRVGRCDIGAYEYDPNNDPLHYELLPVVVRN